MPALSEALVSALTHVVFLFAFRSFPFFCVAIVRRMGCVTTRVGVVFAYVLLVAANVASGRLYLLSWAVFGYAYYLSFSYWLWRASATLLRSYPRFVVFCLLVLALLVFPALVVPPLARSAFLIIGFELTLSSYSFVCERWKSTDKTGASDALEFLLVNPTFVYSDHGERFRAPGVDLWGVYRIVLGVGLMLLVSAVFRPGYVHLWQERLHSGLDRSAGTLGGFVLLRVLAEYGAHSGLASMRIGLMRQFGWKVPECYRYPLFARGPADFWRRWNTYFGAWLLRYVLTPMSRWLVSQRWRGWWVLTLAMLGTFVTSGLLHELYAVLTESTAQGKWFIFFVAAGGVVVGWVWLERRANELVWRHGGECAWSRVLVQSAPIWSYAAVVAFLSVTAVAWGV